MPISACRDNFFTFRFAFFLAQVAMVAASIASRYGGTAAAVTLPRGLAASDPMSPSSRLLPTPSMAVLTTAATVDMVPDDPTLSEHLEVRQALGKTAPRNVFIAVTN